jgi:hypothetical protein
MANGTLQGMFGTGTAVSITEIESITIGDETYTFPEYGDIASGADANAAASTDAGNAAEKSRENAPYRAAFDRLKAIKAGAKNAYGWTTRIK